VFRAIGEVLDELTKGIIGLFIGFLIFLFSIAGLFGLVAIISSLV